MTRIVPNEQTWIGFAHTLVDPTAPTVAEITGATDLTDYIMSLTANATGNTVPIPHLKSLFEPNIPGTSAAQFSGQLYRDDEADIAWTLLPRNTSGYFLISRFGGSGPNLSPAHGDSVEVWPVRVTSRAGDQLTSNTAQSFTLTCAVPSEPAEDATVV